MSMNDMPRVQKLKMNMSRAKSKAGVRDSSSSFILLISSNVRLLLAVLSIPQYTCLKGRRSRVSPFSTACL